MQFSAKRDLLLNSLSLAQGIIEKKNTLEILSNILIQIKENKLIIVATDLDLVFTDEIEGITVKQEGSTTTSATILYDILKKTSANTEVSFELKSENKLNVKTDSSDFNLKCLPTEGFPNISDNFVQEGIELNRSKLLSLLNKTKISISNDDTRHYLSGIFLHLTETDGKKFLTAVATDSHRLSSCSIEIEKEKKFFSLILPKKAVFQLCNLLQESSDKVLMQASDTKIQFKIGKAKLTSKVIDGKFPDYRKVVPTSNDKTLIVSSKDFIDSIETVTTVSVDRKEGVKLIINNDNIKFSVNSTNTGDGNKSIKAKYNSNEISISFNSKYLIDIASEIEDNNIKINLKDSVSPVLIEDNSDKNSYYVVMPMKI